jgi:hypothetical protein
MTHRGSQFPPHGGLDGHKLDRKLVYSKFRPMKVFRNVAEEDMPENPFHSCAFTPTDQVTKPKSCIVIVVVSYVLDLSIVLLIIVTATF